MNFVLLFIGLNMRPEFYEMSEVRNPVRVVILLPLGNEVSKNYYPASGPTRAIQKFSKARRKTANKIVIAVGKSR